MYIRKYVRYIEICFCEVLSVVLTSGCVAVADCMCKSRVCDNQTALGSHFFHSMALYLLLFSLMSILICHKNYWQHIFHFWYPASVKPFLFWNT